MPIRQLVAASVMALAAFSPLSQAASLPSDNQWALFDIDEQSAQSGDLDWIDIGDGSALVYTFSIAAGFQGALTVVDGGFSGDRFLVIDGNTVLGRTSLPSASYPHSIGLDFDAALADSRYSRASYVLGAGNHAITGFLIRSAVAEGAVLNATVGALRLSVSPVPEPATLAALLAGLSLLSVVLRRCGNSK